MHQAPFLPVPVAAAKAVADRCNKSKVVILAHDTAYQRLAVASYGVSPADKDLAAQWAESLATFLGSDPSQRRYVEDFRASDQAVRAARIEQLVKACRAAEHAIRSVLATRTGISDELLQSVADECSKALQPPAENTKR